MSVKLLTCPAKRLAEPISSSDLSFKLNNIKDWNGNNLSSADVGTLHYVVFRDSANTKLEIMEIDGSTIASTSITITKRGLDFNGSTTADVATKYDWSANDTIVELGSNPPQILEEQFASDEDDETIGGDKIATGQWDFTQVPTISGGDPVDDNDAARKAYVDAVVAGTYPANRIVVSGTAGATITAGQLIYLDTSNGRWKLCDADTAATVENVLLGIAQGSGTNGNAITSGVLIRGYDNHQTGLTANTVYYASNTAGGISSTPGTKEVTIGFSLSTTEIYFSTGFNQHITEDQQDALDGTSGTPSAANKYVTADDVSDAAASGKIVRAIGTALPALSGRNLTGVAISSDTYTASGDIADRDAVYVTANDTVAEMVPSSIGTFVSVAQAPTAALAPKLFRLSNGLIIGFSGGHVQTSGTLTAQVHTLNAGETDFANGSSANIFTTSNGTRSYDVAQIGTDKFICIYQKDNAGSPGGIACKAITVSGTTITVGSEQSIEATGSMGDALSIAKLNTDKALIFYRKDSDADYYCQVLTVNGTAITTTIPVVVSTASLSPDFSQMVQISTDLVLLMYHDGAGEDIEANIVTVSGTTPTVGAQQTLYNQATTLRYAGIGMVSTNKFLMVYFNPSENDAEVLHITRSGDTLTAGTPVTLYNGSGAVTEHVAAVVPITAKRALVSYYKTSTTISVDLINTNSANPSVIQQQEITVSSGSQVGVSIAKVKPQLYYVRAFGATGDSLIPLSLPATKHTGIALAAISDAATGSIGYRFTKQTGFTGLTAGSRYYIDDDGQPTTDSALNAIPYGYALNATTMILE